MSIYPRYERAAEIDRMVSAYSANRPGDFERYRNDQQFFLQQNTLRDVLKRLDKAMEDEGVDFRTRDRIVHRVVFCESPEDTSDHLRYADGREENARVDLGRLVDLPPDAARIIADLAASSLDRDDSQ